MDFSGIFPGAFFSEGVVLTRSGILHLFEENYLKNNGICLGIPV
jgi:hypothetical protein